MDENEIHSFVDEMTGKVGVPFWAESFVYFNAQSRDKLVLIPLAFENGDKVSGIISLYKRDNGTDNDFVINAISRQDLLDTLSGNPWQNRLMMNLESFSFRLYVEHLEFTLIYRTFERIINFLNCNGLF